MELPNGGQALLEFKNVTKVFPGVVALNDVSFFVNQGKVHALCGENGAGKSTLMNVLFGIHALTKGEILINGERVEISNPANARNLGIRLVTQEVELCSDLTVAGNIFLGSIDHMVPNWRNMNKEANQIIDELGLNFRAYDLVSQLTVSQRQQLAIAKVYREKSRIILMDEPNSSLNEKESQVLFEIIRQLKANGVTIIYISHRLEEVLNIADEVTVLRNGHHIITKNASETTHEELIRFIVGKDVAMTQRKDSSQVETDAIFELRDFNRKRYFRGVDLSVGRGEIVGLFGLKGSGVEHLIRSAFGIDKRDSGKVFVDRKEISIKAPSDSTSNGIVFVPSDRKEEGIVPDVDVRGNIVISALEKYTRWNVILEDKVSPQVDSIIEKLAVDCTGPKQIISTLSGGNQQKVLLGRSAVFKEAKVLLMTDPTRGVDIGARAEIYLLLNALAKEGLSVLVGSSEVDEILSLCNRVLVMRDGQIVREFMVNETDKEEVLGVALAG